MNEGIGSTTIIVIIVVFIAVVSGYMAFNVNYTKAFRMKNKIISMYERYDGDCPEGSECQKEIIQYAKDIGYSPDMNSGNCDNSFFKPGSESDYSSKSFKRTTYHSEAKYCEYKMVIPKAAHSDSSVIQDSKDQFYYRIVTRIDIRIPIVSNVLDLRFLNVTGDTKALGN